MDLNAKTELYMITRRSTLVCAIFACLILLPFSAQAGTPHFSAIYVFGDSYCDVGNLYAVVGAPGLPYLPGRRSNGPLWVEHIANAWGLPMTPSIAHGNDYAWAGAEVINPIPEPGFSIPNVPQQIAQYLNDHGGKADPNALYILEGGGNDIIDANGSGDPQALGFHIALGLASVELALRHAGAKNFLVPILFDVGLLPAASPNNAFATQATLATNKYLGDLLKLEELLQGIDIRRPDIFSMMQSVVSDPNHFGFTDITHPCITDTVCADPDHTFFWDTYHPTVFGHSFFAVSTIAVYSQR
jgi:phospholipase/lecithinase/hemolysin